MSCSTRAISSSNKNSMSSTSSNPLLRSFCPNWSHISIKAIALQEVLLDLRHYNCMQEDLLDLRRNNCYVGRFIGSKALQLLCRRIC